MSSHLEKISATTQSNQAANADLIDALTKVAIDTKSVGVVSTDLANAAKISHDTVEKFITLAERMRELYREISETAPKLAPVPGTASLMQTMARGEPPLANPDTAHRLSSAIKSLRDATESDPLPQI